MQITTFPTLPNIQAGAAAPDAAAQDTVRSSAPADSAAPSSASYGVLAATVSLSDAAQAYLNQPNPPSLADIQREKKKPKMKTLLEHMLEWARKYEEQRDQAQKEKQFAPVQNQKAGKAAPAPLVPLAIKKSAERAETE